MVHRRPVVDPSLGIDASDVDAYDLVIEASTGTFPIEATSDKDGVRLVVLAPVVDVQ